MSADPNNNPFVDGAKVAWVRWADDGGLRCEWRSTVRKVYKTGKFILDRKTYEGEWDLTQFKPYFYHHNKEWSGDLPSDRYRHGWLVVVTDELEQKFEARKALIALRRKHTALVEHLSKMHVTTENMKLMDDLLNRVELTIGSPAVKE